MSGYRFYEYEGFTSLKSGHSTYTQTLRVKNKECFSFTCGKGLDVENTMNRQNIRYIAGNMSVSFVSWC